MKENLTNALTWLESYPQLESLLAIVLLLLVAWLGNLIVKRVLLRGVFRLVRIRSQSKEAVSEAPFISRLANIVPALIISTGIVLVPNLPPALVTIVSNVASAFIVLTLALAIDSLLTLVNTIYERRPDAKIKPLKGYIQVVKIVIYAVAAILIVATLVDRSPLILLSGLGAMAAVLMLIFQDTLLSLVASVQISSNDIIRVGDWVEMPQLNADGDVIDIALH